jgi:hypothetical protein
MVDYQLNNIGREDIEDLLLIVENSFNIEFVNSELIHITTFGELCDHIANKIQLDNWDDCTTQQAFYTLRNSIASTLKRESNNITTDTLLTDLLPRHRRLSKTRNIEKHLGFKLSILRPPHFVTGLLVITFIASLVGLYFNWKIGLSGFAFSIAGFWFANKIGQELDLKTVGQVAEKMTRENYLKSRRNSKTFNKKEIEQVLTDRFSEYFDLDKSKLTREAKFQDS